MTTIRLAGTIDHQPTTCPPNLTAMCVCGDELGDHISVHVDYAADGVAVCPTTDSTFQLIAGETLDCPSATDCNICNVPVCDEHTNEDEFTTCVDSDNVLHHTDCGDRCRSCAQTAGDEWAAQLASDR